MKTKGLWALGGSVPTEAEMICNPTPAEKVVGCLIRRARCRWDAGRGVVTASLRISNYGHFINVTRIVRTIPEKRPTQEDLFGAFREKYGK